jgi:ribosomal protein S12 methylthiotransferase accessory factor YcaO
MACVAAWLRFEDTRPLAAAGIAASPDPAEALRSAITDAARCRVALVTGLGGGPGALRYPAGQADPDAPAASPLAWDELPAVPGWPSGAPADPGQAALRSCAASGARPLAVDLPADGGLSVVKVLLARSGPSPAGPARALGAAA